jgi:signal transduction histidine kinase/ligand-binding sensor domain-containing protein/DNA-binding response OmpR family regulator
MRPAPFGKRSLLSLSWALATAISFIHAQEEELAFETLPIDQGASTHVSYILQDRTGFIWIATWSGLYRYDGYSFVAYKHNPADSTSIADNLLSTVYEDKAGNLWVGSWRGLEKLDRVTGTFRHYTPNLKAIGIDPSNNVSAICEDKTGGFWVGSWGGLYRFDRITEQFTPVPHDSSNPENIAHNSVGAIYQSKDSSLWFGTAASLDKYDFATGKFDHCLTNREGWKAFSFNVVAAYWITSIVEDDAGIVWLGTQQGLVSYNPGDGSSATYRYDPKRPDTWLNPRNNIAWLSLDPRSGFLWVLTEHGLFSFDRANRTFLRLMKKVVTFLCIERSGTLLLGSETGLQKRNVAMPPFRKYAMGDVGIGTTVGREGSVWVMGYRTAWHKFDTKKESFVPYSFGQYRLAYVYRQDCGGGMVFLRPDGGSLVLDSLGNDLGGLPSSMSEILNTASNTTHGRMGYYIGTNRGGVYLLDLLKGTVKEVLNLQQPIYFLEEDNLGFLWVTTMMGRLVRYDQEQGTFTEYLPDPQNPSSWCGEPVNWPYEDSKGRLWFATRSGLHRWDARTNSFTSYTEKQGLPTNNVRGIQEDQHGNYWVSSTNGISRFDPETGRSKHYDASYGLEPAADIMFGGASRGEDGQMYFGSANGLTAFHPDSIRENLFVPPVVITSFRKFDKPSLLAEEIHLPYDQNFVSFEFAALSYISPERNQYAYMMEGVDRDWVHAGTRRYASYPNLPPGNYVFRVKGSNNEEVWNETGAAVAIVISPPWWKSPWAYGFYVLALLSLLYAAWKMQLRRVRARHEFEMSKFEAAKLHEVDELKSRFFANISHEFRTPLTLIMGPVKRMRDASDDPQEKEELRLVHKNATRLLELVNQLLDLSRLESGSMMLQAAPEDVVPLLKGLLQSFCSYAEQKKISLAFTSSAGSIIVYIDRDKFEKIVTNILANAFKFTPEGGRVEMSVGQDLQHVSIRITDTGVGIPAEKIPNIFDRFYQVDGSHTREQEGTGIGLSLTRELVDLHKGTITVESEEGCGSAFTVRLPLGKAHLLPEEICERKREQKKEQRAEGAGLAPLASATDETGTGEVPKVPPMEVGKPVLLIVEDNADVRQYIRRDLKGEYNILEAVDGVDGWQQSLSQMPDIIISDIMMPKMDGFALCEKLKNDERTSHIPVILLTAKATSRDKIEGFQTGADDYIMKPFEPAELQARLRNLLEQRKRLHEHFRKHGLFEIEEQKITSVDQKFLQRVLAAVAERMSEPAFGVEVLAEQMAVSRSLLLKKMEALTGEAPVELIKRMRLNKAATLIEARFGNAFQVALEVGFSSPSYFSKCFKRQFGVTPSEYHRGDVKTEL